MNSRKNVITEGMVPTIVANSNGTLVTDITKVSYQEIESVRPGIHERMKIDPSKVLDEYLMVCVEVTLSGKYRPEAVNGFDVFAAFLAQQGRTIDLFAASSEQALKKIYATLGMEGIISGYYATLSQAFKHEGKAGKTSETFQKVRAAMHRAVRTPVAYLSHKRQEAELGARVYGRGVLIDPQSIFSVDEKSGIIKVPSLYPEYMSEVYRLLV